MRVEAAAVTNRALAGAFSECLRELGVDRGQGYHLGKPAPLDQQLGATPVASA